MFEYLTNGFITNEQVKISRLERNYRTQLNRANKLESKLNECRDMLKQVEQSIVDSNNEVELADSITSMSHDINQLLIKIRG